MEEDLSHSIGSDGSERDGSGKRVKRSTQGRRILEIVVEGTNYVHVYDVEASTRKRKGESGDAVCLWI